MSPRAINVEYDSPFKLIITFSNGSLKEFNLLPYLDYPVYQPLKNEDLCRNPTIKYGTVIWNEDIDIDPDRLYFESKELSKENA